MQKPRWEEEVKELPAAYKAAPLFAGVLKHLMCEIGELRDRRESMHGELFVGMANKEYRGHWVHRREDYPDHSEWESFCRKHGVDPDAQKVRVRVGKIPTPLGALQAPPEPLTTLIGVFGLAEGSKRTHATELKKNSEYSAWSVSLFYLVKALNLDPQSVDYEALDREQKNLRRAATNFAKVLRGSIPIRTGPGPEEVSPEDMSAVQLVQIRRQEGAAEEQIDQELDAMGYTDKAIAWLKNRNLKIPAPPD